MSPLADANREITAQLHLQRRRQAALLRFAAPLRAADRLIAELEELHLAGRRRVPDSWDARLASFRASLPLEVDSDRLRSRITIVHLMDELYEIEDALLRMKTGSSGDDDIRRAGWPVAG